MHFSQPDSILARDAKLGDCFLGRNCSIRLVCIYRRLEDNRFTDYVFKFRAVPATKDDSRYEAILAYAPDARLARILCDGPRRWDCAAILGSLTVLRAGPDVDGRNGDLLRVINENGVSIGSTGAKGSSVYPWGKRDLQGF